MNIDKYKSLDMASDNELLQSIIAIQLQILRRLDVLDSILLEKDEPMHEDTTENMVDNVESSIDRINEYLAMSDEEKGQLRL